MNTPCLDCGELAKATRCPECQDRAARLKEVRLPDMQESASARGYDWAWTKLSRRARELQPFCSDCGATDDLQADHTPEAWRRKRKRLAIRLRDIDVVCGRCNVTRGAARGERATRV